MYDLFPISRYLIRFKSNQDLQLPAYAGSALRGAFGHALKNIACNTAAPNHTGTCQCVPASSCLYRCLFDPERQTLALQHRLQDIPPPFVIEAHSLPSSIAVDQEAYFYMTLIGEFAHQQLVLIQLAWQRALAIGIGTHRSKGQALAELLDFRLSDQPKRSLNSLQNINIQFISHVRIQHHGHILMPENFDPVVFCSSVVRRYLTLIESYSNQLFDPKRADSLLDDAHQVQGSYSVDQIKWARWSNRQKQLMQMDGLLGKIQLQQVTADLAKILYLGQWLHVGKGSVFGLGQYVLIDSEQ